jgi:hypothetical protein
VCPETQKRILNGTWFWVFVLINGAATNKLQALPFVKEHVTISDSKLRELLLSHWHRQDIINFNSAIKDVLGSKIGPLLSRRIYC